MLIEVLFPSYTMPPLEVHAVYSSARHRPTKITGFVKYLEVQFRKQPGFVRAR
jgi:hypothetical protein